MLEQIKNICLSSLPIIIPAVILAIIIFRGAIIRRLHEDSFPKNLKFAETELVITPAKPLRRTILFGSALYVPQGVNAVTEGASSTVQSLYKPGDYIVTDFFKTVLYYKYVDVTLRNHMVLVEDAPTKDGFNISMQVKFSFRVTNAEQVANMDKPVLKIIMLVENAVRSATIRYKHDELIPTPEKLPVSNSELVNWIRVGLSAGAISTDTDNANEIQISNGIDAYSIVIHNRTGDPERGDYPSDPPEAEQAVLEAENRKKIAEINNQIRLQHAETIVKESNILHPVHERELTLQQQREKPHLELERDRMYFQARDKALNTALQIIAQIFRSPGYDRMFYSRTMNQFRRAFEDIYGSNFGAPDIITAEYRTGPLPSKTPREKLIYRLVDLLKVDGFAGINIQELANGNMTLQVFIKIKNVTNKNAAFFYDMSESDPGITRIILQNTAKKCREVPEANLYNIYPLSEIIEKLNQRYHPDRKKSWLWE